MVLSASPSVPGPSLSNEHVMTPYQDILDGSGRVTTPGYRECEPRYEVIRDACTSLRRPFTVLDLGASEGYFSIRFTDEFKARAVAVDVRSVVRTAEPLIAGVVEREIDPESLRKLGTYDVVLALSFLHHIPNWRAMLEQIIRSTRSLTFVETPHPDEKLRKAINRDQLGDIQDELKEIGFEKLEGGGSGVWDSHLQRGIYFLRRGGIPVSGTVGGGSGNNSLHLDRLKSDLAEMLGYEPFPGSLNVHTKYAFRLGAYTMEYVDERRGRGGRRGGDYQIWPARVVGFDGPAHVIRPGVRGHGRRCLEVWAPVKLRDHLGLKDGDTVNLRIGA